jgi:hypothetical protein
MGGDQHERARVQNVCTCGKAGRCCCLREPRLDVAVDDPLLVHVPHGFGALRKVGPHLGFRQQAAGSACAARTQELFQVAAARPLQHNVQLPALEDARNKGRKVRSHAYIGPHLVGSVQAPRYLVGNTRNEEAPPPTQATPHSSSPKRPCLNTHKPRNTYTRTLYEHANLDERVEVPHDVFVRQRPQQAYFFQTLGRRRFGLAAAAAARADAAAARCWPPAYFLERARPRVAPPRRVKDFGKAAAAHRAGRVVNRIVGQAADGARVEGRREHRVGRRLHFRPDVQDELLKPRGVLLEIEVQACK